MKELLPIIRESQQNNFIFFVGIVLILFILSIKAIFFKRYFALFEFSKYVEIRQNSAVYLFFISILYSLIFVYLFLFFFKSNSLSIEILPTFLVLFLAVLLMIILQFFCYALLWYIMDFKPGNLEVLYNVISYIKTWKIIIFTASFFFYYFSDLPKELISKSIIGCFILFYLFYFMIFIKKLHSQSALFLHGVLYLFIFEIFPLFFIYNLFEKW